MISRIFAPKEFTGRHMAVLMGLFFGTIIAVNIALAIIANTTWTGLVVANSYVESQRFNEVTARRQQELDMGWQSRLTHDSSGLSIDLENRDGKPITGATVTAMVGRPAFEAEDRTVTFTENGAGHYQVEIDLAAGIWMADIQVQSSHGDHWSKPVRFMVAGR